MNAPAPRVPQPSVAKQQGGKQRKQLFVLGGLALLLVVVLIAQLGGSSGVGQSTDDDEGLVAYADDRPDSPLRDLTGVAPGQENVALTNADGEGASLSKNVFSSLWDSEPEVDAEAAAAQAEAPPPAVTLSGTVTSKTRPMAFINGGKYQLGDMVGDGWVLHAVGTREITLRSPSGRTSVAVMPTVNLSGG